MLLCSSKILISETDPLTFLSDNFQSLSGNLL
jgi:hypothetical protein